MFYAYLFLCIWFRNVSESIEDEQQYFVQNPHPTCLEIIR